MSTYKGPRLRIIRRLGTISAFTRKVSARNTGPGQHGASRQKRTPFAARLIEKQKLRYYYGLSEKQLLHCVSIAKKKRSPTGQTLVQKLDIRLDSIIYRIGWTQTLPRARQLVVHGHVLVDKKRTTIPSFLCTPGQNIQLGHAPAMQRRAKKNLHNRIDHMPSHLNLDRELTSATITQQSDCREIPLSLNELLVIEYYSKRV